MTDQKQTSTITEELDPIYDELQSNIPDDVEVHLDDSEPNIDKVTEHNSDIINAYIASENQHLGQQKTVAIIMATVVGLQLIAFNVLIYFVVLKDINIATRKLILDFMKYYTGAVILEMLGMCLFIVKGIYTMSIGKMAEHIIKKKK